MGIPRRQARAVIQQNLVAIAIVPAGNDDRTAVSSQDRRTLRRGNIRTAMAGVAVSIFLAKIAGYVGVTGQRPAEFAVLDNADAAAAEGKQRRAHFIGEKFVQYIVLVLGEIVQLGQFIHSFAADGDVQNIVGLLLRVGVVLGGFGSGVYFFDLVGDLVHSPKGVLDALHLGGIDNDNVAIRVEVGMYCKDGQHLRPVACPCVTVLVVVGDGSFAALWVGRYDVIDGRAEVGVGVGYDFGNRDAVGIAGLIGKQDAHRGANHRRSRAYDHRQQQHHAARAKQRQQRLRGAPHSLGEQGFDFGCDIMNATADCFNRGLLIADCGQLGCVGNDGSGIARRCGSRLLLQIAAHSLAGQVLPL